MMKFTRGETFTTILLAVSGAVITGDEVVSAVMKKTRGGLIPASSVPASAVFEVRFDPEVLPQRKPGWHLTLSPAVTETLTVGEYVADAKITLADGVVEISPPNFITVEQGVTP